MKSRAVLLGAALGLANLLAACQGRPSRASVAEPSEEGGAAGLSRRDAVVVELELSAGLPEARPSSLLGSPRERSLADLLRIVRTERGKERTRGFFLRLGSAQVGLAPAREVGALLAEIRAAGVPVTCHADALGSGSLLLASRACSRLWLSPAGGVETTGLSAQLVFARSLLERLKVDVDFLQVGKFKGAQEPFTRDEPSPEARASLEGALRGLRVAWAQGLEEGRGRPGLASVAEAGPYAPGEALERGLVDAVGYADEALAEARREAPGARLLSATAAPSVALSSTAFPVPPPPGSGLAPLAPSSPSSAPPDGEPLGRVLAFGDKPEGSRGGGLGELARALAGQPEVRGPHVVVMVASGAITMGREGGLPLGGVRGISEQELGARLERLAADPSVAAVVLRVDSPGGSALASDLLWRRLMQLRERKPLVASVGGMAASGGYYLASAASAVFAEPTSLLGSIGVVGGKLSFGRTLQSLGVHVETVAAAPDPALAGRASYMSPLQAWDEGTRGRVLASMTSVYELFVRRVAEGRRMPRDRVERSAEGQVFGGAEALERGLVDTLGGLDAAVVRARELAHLPEDAPVELVREEGGLSALLAGEGVESALQGLQGGSAQALVGGLLPPSMVQQLLTFAASASPLASGELAVTALPFACLLR